MADEMDKGEALEAGAKATGLAILKQVPVLGLAIEGVQAYHESIENQQREQFTQRLLERVERIEANREWYQTPHGEQFVKKVVATALNAEYTDKLDVLANALANGPSLGDDEARQMKFVEMIRQLSKPALEVLVVAIEKRSGTGQVMSGELATAMKWDPALVDACVNELDAAGAFSNVIEWYTSGGDARPKMSFSEGIPAVTSFSAELANFIR